MSGPEFRPIPGWPGYSIARDGRVIGACGFELKKPKGAISVYHKGKSAKLNVGDLIAQIWRDTNGSVASATPPPKNVEVEMKPATLTDPVLALAWKKADEALAAQRRAESTLERVRRERDSWREKARKLERQRDNLAARRLVELSRRTDWAQHARNLGSGPLEADYDSAV